MFDLDDIEETLNAAHGALQRGDWANADRLYLKVEQMEAEYYAGSPACFVTDEE